MATRSPRTSFQTTTYLAILGLFCLGAVLSAPTSWANPSEKTQFIYTFENGNQLLTIPGTGVLFREKKRGLFSKTKEDKSITDYPRIEQFSETESLKESRWVDNLEEKNSKPYSAWVRHYDTGDTLTIFEAGPEVHIVNQEGHSIKLPLPDIRYNHVEVTRNEKSVSVWDWSARYLRYNNQSYAIFCIKQKEDSRRGVTFLIREDLKIVYLGEIMIQGIDSEVRGSKLSFKTINYEFDLEKFNETAKQRAPRKNNQDAEVLDEEGKKSTASRVVHKNFQDYGKLVSEANVTFEPLDPRELRDLRRALIKKQNGSIFITGDSGAGKTELMQAFVKEVQLGKFEEIPAWTEFLQVDPSAADSGVRYTGMYEARFNALIKYARGNDVVLVLDEAHTMRGSGSHESDPNDFFQRIKPYLANGSIRMIGTTTDEEFNAAFSGDLSLARRIVRIQKKPIPTEKIDSVLVTWAEKMGYAPLAQELRRQVYLIAKDFDAVGLDVVKALRLLDEFYADLAIDGKTPGQAQIDDLQRVAAHLYNMDSAYFDSRKRITLINNLAQGLDKDIIHHTELKTALINDTLLALTGTTDLSKPKIRRLFAGPKGLGKTHAAKIYAKQMKLPFVRINLAEYAGKKPEDLLLEVGSALRKNAFTVILFDEVEKAPKSIQEALLGVLDSDTFTMTDSLNGVNRSSGPKTYSKVRTTNASIILATNAGQNEILKRGTLSPSELRAAIVNDGFSEFLLDRCRDVHAFLPPKTKAEFIDVVKAHLDGQIEQLEKQKGIKLSIQNENEFLSEIADKYFDPTSGYRAVLSEIENVASMALARKLLAENVTDSCSLLLTSDSPHFGARGPKKIGFQ